MKFVSLVIAVLVALPAAAQELEGRTIRVTGAPTGHPTPVSVPIKGEVPSRGINVHDTSGAEIPATAHDGRLTFLASQPGDYTVKVSRKSPKQVVSLRDREKENRIDVEIGGELFTSFYYSPDDGKPALWPIVGEGGAHLTRDYPLGERDVTGDHPHHKSVWTGYGHVNESDYWEYGKRTGKQVLQNIEYGSGEALGYIVADFTWIDTEGEPVIDERREMIFYATDADARIFDYNVLLKASHGPIHFTDTKEGGLVSLRMADKLRERGGTGTITNSAGGVGAKETWGKPAAWCDYSGPIEGIGTRGMTVFDHPSNFRHPTHWHVRDYGLMGANAFGYSHFYDGERNGDHDLPEGAEFPFHYRLYVHSGDVNEAQVAEVYAAYAQPLEAAWVD